MKIGRRRGGRGAARRLGAELGGGKDPEEEVWVGFGLRLRLRLHLGLGLRGLRRGLRLCSFPVLGLACRLLGVLVRVRRVPLRLEVVGEGLGSLLRW